MWWVPERHRDASHPSHSRRQAHFHASGSLGPPPRTHCCVTRSASPATAPRFLTAGPDPASSPPNPPPYPPPPSAAPTPPSVTARGTNRTRAPDHLVRVVEYLPCCRWTQGVEGEWMEEALRHRDPDRRPGRGSGCSQGQPASRTGSYNLIAKLADRCSTATCRRTWAG